MQPLREFEFLFHCAQGKHGWSQRKRLCLLQQRLPLSRYLIKVFEAEKELFREIAAFILWIMLVTLMLLIESLQRRHRSEARVRVVYQSAALHILLTSHRISLTPLCSSLGWTLSLLFSVLLLLQKKGGGVNKALLGLLSSAASPAPPPPSHPSFPTFFMFSNHLAPCLVGLAVPSCRIEKVFSFFSFHFLTSPPAI